MKSPVCRICDKVLEVVDDGGLIYFKKRPSDIEWEKKMEQIGRVGHPQMLNGFVNSILRKRLN